MLKPLTFSILRHLSDGEFHSGEAIAASLGVSRANIWYALKNVGQAGVALRRVRGRGYRLAGPIDWLDADQVARELGEESALFRIEILDTADSTNTRVLDRVNAPHGLVIAAEWQLAGRGRLGRPWHSALGDALTFSLLWRFPQGAGSLAGLSLAVSVAVVRALVRAKVSGLMLKWPNDILWRHRKLAGILIEIAGDAVGPASAVIGIGINVKLSSTTKAQIDQAAGDLGQAGCTMKRSALLACVLSDLADVLRLFSVEGFGPFAPEWQRLHAYHEKRVTLKMPDGSAIAGKIAGAANDGSLMLETKSGMRRFYGGEISFRHP
ncbi:MAG: biotin--[acetyl-CoA-carboxylase] ligase [Burkholderiales bacterium]